MASTNLDPIAAGAYVSINGVARLRDSATPVNLTGGALTLRVKRKSTDADADDLITKTSTPAAGITITNAAAGEFTIVILPADTSAFNAFLQTNLVYDVWLVDSGSNPYQLAYGTFVVRGSVTHSP